MNRVTKVFIAIIIGIILLFTIYSIQDSNSNSLTDNQTMKTDNAATKNTIVELQTNYGNIRLEIFSMTMPITAGNFEKLVRAGFYDGIIFHRVIPKFMIQSGDPTGTGMGGPGYTIKDEFSNDNHNDRGTIAMANTGAKDSGGSQFFINLVNNNYLDTKHPVFGKVISGLEVIDNIGNVATDNSDRPLKDVIIEKAVVID